MTEREFRQRAFGAVIGSAVGDALGAPFEFDPRQGQYSARFHSPVFGGIGEMTGGGGWEPGEFTDDTQMAIVQAESILERGGIDGAHLFEQFQLWATDAKDVGIQTHAILTSGRPWDVAAGDYYRRTGKAAGNGSLMRATPTAVHYANRSVEETIDAARRTSAITHGDPAAGWGTAIFHVMVRAALAGDDPFVALADVLTLIGDDDERYHTMLAPEWEPGDTTLSNGTVWTCLAQAVWVVRRSGSFAEAVIAAIDLGGDTDTVAAVAGGLAGATHGIQAIPSRWTTYLHGRITTAGGPRTYRAADLQDLTLRLLGTTPAPASPLVERRGPVEIAPGVYAADLGAASEVPHDWAVISLCRVGERFANHPVCRQMYILDESADQNDGLAAVIEDAVATIDAFLAEGRRVVVHCHGGASRTGLVLRAWLMHHNGWDEPTATAHVAARWPHLGLWNEHFNDFLRNDWSHRPPSPPLS